MASSHRVTDLDKIPVRISKDEAPMPISSLLFDLSRTLLGAWRFSLFCSVYCSFHNRLDLIMSVPGTTKHSSCNQCTDVTLCNKVVLYVVV